MGVCFQNKRKQTVTLEELDQIYKYLSDRKDFLQKTYGTKLNTQNNDNEKPESLKEYEIKIDKLSKEVFELEKINNLWGNQDNNIQIKFFFEGLIYIINANKETKLGDAFQKAVFNGQTKVERYTTIMSNETKFSTGSFKNNEIFNYNQMMFLLGGENITEHFMKNEPVSSLGNNSDSFFSIIVQVPLNTKVMLKASYNKFYLN